MLSEDGDSREGKTGFFLIFSPSTSKKMTDATHEYFMEEAARLASQGVRNGKGGPFGAVVVLNGQVVGRGSNCVTSTNDPTAHAEVQAIRDACQHLNNWQLQGATIYTSCEPCPMCLAAIYWARLEKIYYACSQHTAAAYGFDDSFIYQQVPLPPPQRTIPGEQLHSEAALQAFEQWKDKPDKLPY